MPPGDAPPRPAAAACGRSDGLLELELQQDAEATVVGHLPGSGRLPGLTGAIRVRDDSGLGFVLGRGLDDALRRSPPPIGSLVTCTCRGRTSGGQPRFASFLRLAAP